MPRGGKPGNKGGGNKTARGTSGNTGGGASVGNVNSTSNWKKAETLYCQAEELYRGGDLDEALQKSEALLELEEGHAKALNLTAAICHLFYFDGIVVKPFEVIVDLYKRAMAAGSVDAEESLIRFLLHGKEGNLKNGEFKPAASDAEQILEHRKLRALDGSADAKNDYDECILLCLVKGNRSESLVQAEETLRAAVSLEPDHVGINVNLATVLKEAGKLDKAIAAFKTVLILQPGYNYAKFMLDNLLSDQVYFVTSLSETVACELALTFLILQAKIVGAKRSIEEEDSVEQLGQKAPGL